MKCCKQYLGLLFSLASVLLAGSVQAQGLDRMNSMDHGPFASQTYTSDPLSPEKSIIAHKAIAVRVGSEPEAVMAFDTDLLRVSSAWTGGFLHWYPTRDGLEEWPSQDGFTHFQTAQRPGWSTGNFDDPRAWPYGPIPEEQGRYEGLYLHEDQVVFSYRVAGSDVLERFEFETVQGRSIFTRIFNMHPPEESLSLHVLQTPEGAVLEEKVLPDAKRYVTVRVGPQTRMVGLHGAPEGIEWDIRKRHLILELPALQEPLDFELSIGPVVSDKETDYMAIHLDRRPAVPDLDELRRPGPSRWEVIETQAVTGTADGPFAVDKLTLPTDNPWNSWMRPSGFDFLSDGRLAVASLSGDVWLVSGIQESLETLRWKRFATGLNQPLGVEVVDDQIYVTGRDQITRLHDQNGDGEADFYENFNNEVMAATNFHEFTMNLETDSQGNFYFARGTPWPPLLPGHGPPRKAEITPHNGVLLRVPPAGDTLETVATGLRNPNGLAISPNDEIVYADNQGNWVPANKVHLIKEGGFYGFVPAAHTDDTPEEFERPIVWMPQSVDNSPGTPIWITSEKWPAELHGDLLLTSYGKASLALLLTETIDRERQGGLLNLPLEFDSGLHRGQFHEDGHLYVAGLTSWQSAGKEWGALHRVRYTGRPLHLPVAMNVQTEGIQLTFAEELDPEFATDVENYHIEQWTYRWTEQYGSARYSAENPDKEGADPVEPRSITLSENQKSVFLEISDLQPVMNLSIRYTLKAADGSNLEHEIHNTINRVPSGRAKR